MLMECCLAMKFEAKRRIDRKIESQRKVGGLKPVVAVKDKSNWVFSDVKNLICPFLHPEPCEFVGSCDAVLGLGSPCSRVVDVFEGEAHGGEDF